MKVSRHLQIFFKQMYKKTPNEYRMNEEFYPLQLRFDLIQTVKQKLSQQEMEEKYQICYNNRYTCLPRTSLFSNRRFSKFERE